MARHDGGGGPAHVNDLYQPAGVLAPTLEIVRAANQVNDNDSIGHSFSSVSAGTDTIAQSNAVIRENERMRQELKDINRLTRRQRAKGKHARKRHVKMSAEDLNNVTAIRNFVKKQVFPHYKLKEPGWNKWCVDPKSISKRCCKLTVRQFWITDEDWWIDDGTPVCSNAKSNLSSNYKEGTRKQSECEYPCKIIC